MSEYIYEVTRDADGIDCYIKRGEMVRCKDCKNADYAGCPKGRCYCMEHGTYFDSDDYCSYGEREDGDEE